MSRSAGISVENNFSRGLITEVTGMNSPENSVSDSLNTIFDLKGRSVKRNGLDFENEYEYLDLQDSSIYEEYVWDLSGDRSFVVIQIGKIIRFFNVSNSALSRSMLPYNIDLSEFKVQGISDEELQLKSVSFTSGKDYLFITHPLCDPFYVKFKRQEETFSSEKIVIQIRDFEGVDDGLKVDEDQDVKEVTGRHLYNLMNQGWYAEVPISQSGFSNAFAASLSAGGILGRKKVTPRNCDIPYLWMRTNPKEGFLYFDKNSRKNVAVGSSSAPKGHYILDAFSMNRNGITGEGAGAWTTWDCPTTTSLGQRPSCVSFYMGRVFYSGVDSEGYRNTIYFSQIIERDDQISKCYQANDPTSEHAPDLLANDGGTIKILDLDKVISMKTIGQSLYVFATNGVWTVSGTVSAPFTANDYAVTRISTIGVRSPTGLVVIKNTPMWWNHEGIYTIESDQSGQSVVRITETTIQSFFDKIPQSSKDTVKSVYSDQDNLVYWMYKDTTDKYNRLLILDLQTSGFYPFSFDLKKLSLIGMFITRPAVFGVSTDNVTTLNSSIIMDSSGEVVQIEYPLNPVLGTKKLKFIVKDNNSKRLTFAEFNDSYVDFKTVENSKFSSYFITGYRVRGDLMRQSQVPYLTVVTEEHEKVPSSAYVQALWNYSRDINSGKFTNPQQIYTNDKRFSYGLKRLKMRGSGKSVQFKFYGVEGLPFIIIGWSGFETVGDSIE